MIDKKILVVEDDDFLMKVYTVKLANAGYQMIKAMDGEEALTLVKEHKPDLVLLDLIIPKKTGFTVLEEMKNDPETKNIPVIILSNLGQDEDVKKGIQLGAVDYVVKADIPIEEVMNKINKQLEK
jgi:DNA-binding response OmpR family regulator